MSDAKVKTWAGFWPRIGAFLIDFIVIGAAAYAVGALAFDFFAHLGEYGRLIGLLIGVAYFGILSSKAAGGRTLGLRLLRLRVIARDGDGLGLGLSLVRAVVLMLPFVLNGIFINDDGSPLRRIFGALVVGLLFGIGLAQIYLLIFNRPNRRLLHDLIVGSSVIISSADAPSEPRPTRTSNAAFGILAATLLVALSLVFLSSVLTPQFMKDLTVVQEAVQALPEVTSAGVMDSTTRSIETGKSPAITKSLVVTAKLRQWPKDENQEVARIGRVVSETYRLKPGQGIQVNLIYGFTLGIANGSRSFGASYPS